MLDLDFEYFDVSFGSEVPNLSVTLLQLVGGCKVLQSIGNFFDLRLRSEPFGFTFETVNLLAHCGELGERGLYVLNELRRVTFFYETEVLAYLSLLLHHFQSH